MGVAWNKGGNGENFDSVNGICGSNGASLGHYGKTVANWGIRVGSHAALLIPIPDKFGRLDYGSYLSNYTPEVESWVNLC